MIKKILVANRGEIAVRVFRAAREMGIRTVAVFSEADKHSLHVAYADEAVCIGPPEAANSYLKIENVLDAARSSGADAIHPGYGFLSERAEFSEACVATGITFIGPSAAAMRKLGAKIDAKQLAVEAKVPITPGYFELGATSEQLLDAAEKIGFPVMPKASAGGGGRGMRIVRRKEDFLAELHIAGDEALKSFGDDAMMVEKLVDRPRHIEVQLLADQHGQVACLFERECSLQRRHQKLVEEAPSPVIGEEQWAKLGGYARELALRAGYTGAGTVEFMLDEAAGELYFLEVNARLQVEHPVTEAITGVDLVKEQIRIAQGEKLNPPSLLLAGKREAINGHAIEVRIIAEDPAAGFLPSAGFITTWAEPKAPGVRVDSGFGAGREVPRYYDSLIAKLIVHGGTRHDAIEKLKLALQDFHILGIKTNIAYILDVISSQSFKDGHLDTGLLGREFGDWKESEVYPAELASLSLAGKASQGGPGTAVIETSPWTLSDGFRNVR